MKVVKFICNLWGIVSLLVCIGIGFLVLLGNMITISPVKQESIKVYQEIYKKVNNEEFVKGTWDENGSLVLVNNQEREKSIDFTISAPKKYFYEIEKNERGDIVLKKSGGVFDDDYEIIFTSNMYFEQNKYVEITNLEKNMFLCKLK